MRKDPPFDVWNGVDLDTAEAIEDDAVEETAMHLDPESDVAAPSDPAWSELTDEQDAAVEDDAAPMRYFEDEQPEGVPSESDGADEDHELDLEELLERQHYAFKVKAKPSSRRA